MTPNVISRTQSTCLLSRLAVTSYLGQAIFFRLIAYFILFMYEESRFRPLLATDQYRYASVSYHVFFTYRQTELVWPRWPWAERFMSVVCCFSSRMDEYLLRMRSGICFARLVRGVISMLSTHIYIWKNISP